MNYLTSILIHCYPPAKTFDEPAATEVQPLIPSPILPAPLLFTNTVEEPDAIGAEWPGQGAGGKR
jgi:hypothetical protein